MVPVCVNLRDLAAGRYKISHDPAAVTRGEKADPWMMTIPCQGGITIYPHGGTRLAVEVDRHPHIARALRELPGVIVSQDGDHEKTFLTDVSLFDQVVAIVKPRKRRRSLTAEERQAARVRLAPYAFQKGRTKKPSLASGTADLAENDESPTPEPLDVPGAPKPSPYAHGG